MDRCHLERCAEINQTTTALHPSPGYVSLEAEIPEDLYLAMKDFLATNPNWDQYRVMSSALANFLFQNGCGDRAVTERYLNDLFSKADS